MKNSNPSVRIRFHGVDGSVETFVQHEASLVKHILNGFQPARIFAQERITIAGGYSFTTVIASQVTRIDLVSPQLSEWDFPDGVVGAVELSERTFRGLVSDPQLKESPETSRRDSTMAFLDIAMVRGRHSFLAMELAAGPAADQINGLHLLPGLSFRMRLGGISLLNFANLSRLTIHPGTAQAPAGSWFAHHPNCPEDCANDQGFDEFDDSRLQKSQILLAAIS
jgi:hypothetical protein